MAGIWILGATGRTGGAIARQLAVAKLAPVLVGRDAARLRAVAAGIGEDLTIETAESVDTVVRAIGRCRPAVVVNTIGPFVRTAVPIARACPPGTHYVDVSNELSSFLPLLALHDEAVATGRTFVTGGGFGVLATESVVLKLCEGRPPAVRVRVDALPSVETEAGRIGWALAATMLDAAAAGGRHYANGRLRRSRLFGDLETLTLPDGTSAMTAAIPSGDLEAARRASNATFAVAASSYVPAAPMLRAVLPAALTLLRIKPLRSLATRQMARIELKAQKPRTEFSWTRARVVWSSGALRQGWLRTGDAMSFTVGAMTEIVSRLARNEGRPGAWTPGALFGPDLAIAAGGQFFLDPAP